MIWENKEYAFTDCVEKEQIFYKDNSQAELLKFYLAKYTKRVIYIMNNGYSTKFVPQSISLHSDFSSASWSMATLSAGTDDIVTQSDVTPEEASGITEEKQMENANRRLAFLVCFLNLLQEA